MGKKAANKRGAGQMTQESEPTVPAENLQGNLQGNLQENLHVDLPVIDSIVASKETLLISDYASATPVEAEMSEKVTRNRMFEELVSNDEDLIGLVAYALYKQSKRDWLMAFETENGRVPTDEELKSYIIGECTPRRIETYRRLGADSLVRLRPQTATPIGASQTSTRAETAQPLSTQADTVPPTVSRSWIRQVAVIIGGVVAGVVLIRFGIPAFR
jgi:hypothetical protein